MGIFMCLSALNAHAQKASYKDKTLSPESRAAHLLTLMTAEEKIMQTQCLWIQKSKILNASGDFDSLKAAGVLKNGLGELARLNENAGPNSYGYHPRQAAA